LAEFRDLAENFRALGIQIAALAVDTSEQSDRVRCQYELPFPILCDTQKDVVRAWGLFNAREKGGIAVPAVLLIGRDRRIQLAAIEGVATRVRAADLLASIRAYAAPANSAGATRSDTQRQRVIFPSLSDFGRAIWNILTKR
jgi:peroxiredoxin